MVGVMMTTYDGILSMLLQPLMGSIITIVSMLIISVIFSPLLLTKVWGFWQRIWFVPTLLMIVAFVLLYMSWMPEYRIMVKDPETNSIRPSFHPVLSISGWFTLIFSVMWNPKIGFLGQKRWV